METDISPIKNISDLSIDIPSSDDYTFYSPDRSEITVMPSEVTRLAMYRILTRNGSKFVGALSRRQGFDIWKDCFQAEASRLHGISLVQSANKPFILEFHLYENVPVDSLPKSFSHMVDGSTYQGELFIEDTETPLLGEQVKVFIRRTRFRVSPVQIKLWLSLFGTVVTEPAYIPDEEASQIFSDDLTCYMTLTRHMYGQLPAFGRKLRVSYKGQPVQCNACYGLGHLRSECKSDRVDWLKYCKVIQSEFTLATTMLGRWHNLMVENKI